MTDGDTQGSPLDTVAGSAGDQTIEAFSTLGNDTRLAILLVLWDAYEPFGTENALSFSELYDRLAVDDSGNFTYHLDQLVGPFVEQHDAGYSLSVRAERILRAVIAGTLDRYESFEDEEVDASCDRCGAPMVIDYRDSVLFDRCTECSGRWGPSAGRPTYPLGTLRAVYRPRAGLRHRTPQEFHRQGNAWDRLRMMSNLAGVCPDCMGSVETSLARCDSHDVSEGSICPTCGSFWEIQLRTVCKVCKAAHQMAPFAHIHTVPSIKGFYHEYGIDPDKLYDSSDIAAIRDTIAETAIVTEDPPTIRLAIEIEDERLEVVLDVSGQGINVIESTG